VNRFAYEPSAMKVIVLGLLVGFNIGLEPRTANASGVCPADDIFLRTTVIGLVTEPNARTSLGMTAVDPAHLRPLVDTTDLAACQKLQAIASGVPDGVTSVVRSYYTADGFYFAAVAPTAVGGYGAIYVFDSDWNRKDVVLI
jgi:hypothetical protein